MTRFGLAAACALALGSLAFADDWPMFGRDRTRNAVSREKGAPIDWQVAVAASKDGPAKTARNIKWSAQLGSLSLGGPVIANGLVWVGTNNQNPRNPADMRLRRDGLREPIDKAVLMCFRESDGQFLWQFASPRLEGGYVQDGPHHSMGTPVIEGDTLWLINNRREVVCLDVAPLRRGDGQPKEHWRVDIRREFGVFPHADLMSGGLAATPAADAERLFVVTGNGVDERYINIPTPNAPSLVCLEKKTGKRLWSDASPGKNIMHCQLSSPLVIDVAGRTQVVVGQGDGWLRSFDAATGQLIWKCDANPKGTRYELGGRSRCSYFMATPIWYEGRIHIAPGQSPEYSDGEGVLLCIDPQGTGDVSAELDDGAGKGKPNPQSRVVWKYGGPDPKDHDRNHLFGRSMSNCIAHDGLLYAVDLAEYLFCFDAKTGQLHWRHDLKDSVWCAPLLVDGKLYVATASGTIEIFAHGKDKKRVATIELDEMTRASPVFANGALYLMTDRTLFAIAAAK